MSNPNQNILKGYCVGNNEYIVFDDIDCEIYNSLFNKYGEPEILEFDIPHEYGVYHVCDYVITYIDKIVKIKDIYAILYKMKESHFYGYRMPVYHDPYTYEGKTSR